MNFASKKLSEYYSTTASISDREKALLAENKKLRQKNKRLSTAMLYLVDQIEIRLPFWNARKKKETEAEKPIPAPAIKRVKKNVIGKVWKPEKLGPPGQMKKHSAPLSMHQLFAEKKNIRPETPKEKPISVENLAEEPQIETVLPEQTVKVAETTERPQTPELAPEEMNLLASPTKDKAKELTSMSPAELFIKPEQKKTSLQEASQTYMAVSMASSPVPSADEQLDDEEKIEQQLVQQNNMMREAMLRRVNRLRW